MNFIRRMLGIAPTSEGDGRGYIPSPLGLFLGVDKKSGYQPTDFRGRKYVGDKKVMVLCTEERYLEMTSGVLFSTGQNVQETTVPLMHLVDAGFDFDVVTPTGAPPSSSSGLFRKRTKRYSRSWQRTRPSSTDLCPWRIWSPEAHSTRIPPTLPCSSRAAMAPWLAFPTMRTSAR